MPEATEFILLRFLTRLAKLMPKVNKKTKAGYNSIAFLKFPPFDYTEFISPGRTVTMKNKVDVISKPAQKHIVKFHDVSKRHSTLEAE